jgi:hypothetical protein
MLEKYDERAKYHDEGAWQIKPHVSAHYAFYVPHFSRTQNA